MSKNKVALITGIGGQDGSYLAELLLEKGYLVRGLVRRSSNPNTSRIDDLLESSPVLREHATGTPNSPIFLRHGDLSDASSLRNVIEEVKPDEIYNLAAQSHVGISFQNGESTLEYNALGVFRILDTLRSIRFKGKFYQASSSEMFGASPPPQNEQTPFMPQSPYGVAKVAGFYLTQMHRRAYGLFASNGILFNHESPRRGLNFVTRKITFDLAKILTGIKSYIELGNLDAKRDWGFSKEYVEAMWMILQHDQPDDFVIATEETHTVRDFLRESFNLVGLDYRRFVKTSDGYKRPAEVPALLGDSSKAKRVLGWEPKVKFRELIAMMVSADIKNCLERTGRISAEPANKKPQDYYIQIGRELARELPERSFLTEQND